MPTGELRIGIVHLDGTPVRKRIEVELKRFSGDLGAGGASCEAKFTLGGEVSVDIAQIACRPGPGTMYRVQASTKHYRPYSFFQLIREDRINTAADDVEFWVKPGDVKKIAGPEFADLHPKVRKILTDADMRAEKREDRDLTGAVGASLYARLGPLRKACLLNIATKASHASAARCLTHIQALLMARQDRFFAFVDDTLPRRLEKSAVFKAAENALHDPLKGFELTGESFKSRDAHANLQVTFMRDTRSGRLAADIDIDESSGIEHGFEVIRNALFRRRTNPYLIREFLLSADRKRRSLDPGYTFVF